VRAGGEARLLPQKGVLGAQEPHLAPQRRDQRLVWVHLAPERPRRSVSARGWHAQAHARTLMRSTERPCTRAAAHGTV